MHNPAALRSAGSHTYVPAIDALRALAVVAVMVYHLTDKALPGGFAGVDVFFVISGYVVAGSMLRDGHRPFWDFIAAFYARRFRRIAPAMLVCLLATVLSSAILIPNSWLSSAIQDTGLAAFYGFSNFALVATNDGYFAPRTEYNPFTHTWSLAVEEQFYLVFPLIFYFCIRRDSGRLASFARWVLVLLCSASFAWCIWASSMSPSLAYYMLPSRFWELGLGAATCLIGDDWRSSLVRKFGPERLLAIGLALIAIALVSSNKQAFPFPWAIPATVGTVILLISTAAGPYRSRWSQALTSSGVLWVGLLSYSLYLWHWPIYTLMRWTVGLQSAATYAVAIGMTVMVAWLSYRFVEQPPQRSQALRQFSSLRVIILGLTVVILGWAIASVVFARPWFFKQTVVEHHQRDWYSSRLSSSTGSLAGKGAGCLTSLERQSPGIDVFRPYDCSHAVLGTGQRVFVVGDSHARALTRLLDEASKFTGLEIWRFSEGGCALAPVVLPSSAQTLACKQFLEATVQSLEKMARKGDIVILESLRVDRFADAWGPVTGTALSKRSAEVAEQEAMTLVRSLQSAGLTVVFVLPKPVFSAPAFRCADWFNRTNPVCAPGFEIPKQQVLSHRASAVQSIMKVVLASPGSLTWDPLPTLCPGDICRAFDGKRPIYFDADHLSGHGNELLLPEFASQLNDWLQGKSDRLGRR